LKRRNAINPNNPKINPLPTLPPPPVLTDLSSIPDTGSWTTVAEMRKSYGGCEVPAIDQNYTIQLDAGTYTLNKELTPKIALNI
ncbi:hypothetical protein IAF28_20100, partial [Acinetobacter baumannii]|nr:hypothetical protein [Acinetobacter baumannii]MBD0176068.1 hypothetical protein [Acinetobacter baumannii]